MQMNPVLCPCGSPMIACHGVWICPRWYLEWMLGEDLSAHE